MKHEILGVNGMACGHCEAAIQHAVRQLPGILKVKASRRKKQVTIDFDENNVQLAEIKSAIAATGYTVLDVN